MLIDPTGITHTLLFSFSRWETSGRSCGLAFDFNELFCRNKIVSIHPNNHCFDSISTSYETEEIHVHFQTSKEFRKSKLESHKFSLWFKIYGYAVSSHDLLLCLEKVIRYWWWPSLQAVSNRQWLKILHYINFFKKKYIFIIHCTSLYFLPKNKYDHGHLSYARRQNFGQ
jgi:hypothetical protein